MNRVNASVGTWTPLQSNSLSWSIVKQVRTALYQQQLKSGDFLGSESILAQQFGVSRMAARDALRTLEALGIVEIRMGVRGGAWIAEGNPDRFSDALSVQLMLIGLSPAEIFDAQGAIVVASVTLAAQRANNQDILEIKNALKACEIVASDADKFSDASLNFQESLVRASANRVLLAQFRALRVVLDPILKPNTTATTIRRLIKSNRALLVAVENKDVETAARLMRERVESVKTTILLAKQQELMTS
jgi:DNA-binding FadR family transcriptional regulator